eukprot:scpid46308/ scgid30928/ 
MQSSTLAAAAAASHNSNGLSEQHGTCKLRTRQMLRTTIEQRHNQGRARGEMSRAQLRAEHQQETEYLCAMALQNDERASKKRAGGPVGLGAGDVRKIASSHEMGVGPMLGMPGNASASGLGAAGAGPHHHLHGPPQNRPAAPGVCDGLVCPHSTMDPSGLAGLSAPLCNASSSMQGMMDDPYALGNAPLASSAPSSYGMTMSQQQRQHPHHPHLQHGSAEWHSSVPAAHDPAFRGMDAYPGASFPHDAAMPPPSSMDMMSSAQMSGAVNGSTPGQLHHSDPAAAAAAAAAQMASQQNAAAMRRGSQSMPAGALPPSSQMHIDMQMREQYMQRGSLSSVGTPTTPNHVDGSLEAAYNWPSNVVRTSSAATAHPPVGADFSAFPSGTSHAPQQPQAALSGQPSMHQNV